MVSSRPTKLSTPNPQPELDGRPDSPSRRAAQLLRIFRNPTIATAGLAHWPLKFCYQAIGNDNNSVPSRLGKPIVTDRHEQPWNL
jgi:hypothetical protein